MIIVVELTAPERPAARANGTVNPSDMPITISRTVSPAVKCCSICGVCGIGILLVSVEDRRQDFRYYPQISPKVYHIHYERWYSLYHLTTGLITQRYNKARHQYKESQPIGRI